MALGVSPISNDLNRAAMGFQASMLEQLGQQVRQDLRVVQTNRQLQGFAQQVQSVDPTAPDFAQKISGVMAQFPLAATSPLGAAAINQLGAQRSFYQQQFMADKAFDRQIGVMALKDNIDNGLYGRPPLTAKEAKDIATGKTPPKPSIPPTGSLRGQMNQVNNEAVLPVSGNPLDEVGAEVIGPQMPLKQSPLDQLMSTRNELIQKGVPGREGELIIQGQIQDMNRAGDVVGSFVGEDGFQYGFDRAGNARRMSTPEGPVKVRPPASLVSGASERAELNFQRALVKDEEKQIEKLKEDLKKVDPGTGPFTDEGGALMFGRKMGGNKPATPEAAQRWMRLNSLISESEARVQAKRKALESGVVPVGTQAVAATSTDPRRALAQKALDDPNATEAHKAAARKILGL